MVRLLSLKINRYRYGKKSIMFCLGRFILSKKKENIVQLDITSIRIPFWLSFTMKSIPPVVKKIKIN
jgi:hypothetical protein